MSTDLIIKNALLVTCDQRHSVLEDAAILVSGNNIKWVGFSRELENHNPANTEIIDATGKILMPGLINMHSHCGDTLFRGLVENLPLEQWLQTVWKSQAVILRNAENCRLGAELGFAELLLGGTTTLMDQYWHPDQTITAALDAGIRIATGGIFFDPHGMDGYSIDHRATQAHELFARHGGNEEIFVGTMPHGTYTAGPDSIRTAVEIANQYGGFFSIHAAETKVEQQTIRDRYQTSVIRLLNDLGALSPRTTLAHCVHVDDEEIDLMAANKTNVVHNPLSNLKLASGFAPITKMMAKGINVTLGTDGAISGNDMDMWFAMRLAATIHKAANENPSAISSHETLHMATLNGARALAAEDMLGSIELNKRADFILVDITGPHAMPMFDPVSHLVFSAAKSDVSDVFISGRHIVKDRNLLTLNLSDIQNRITELQPAVKAALDE
ncbi:MAG: amidohydrolase [Hyphomicrobiales bacterium]|nr:amidohydrolase [Hyphomicrobiales bacterium]